MAQRHHWKVSNPSRGTCAFGQQKEARRKLVLKKVSNPSRGTCAFGHAK